MLNLVSGAVPTYVYLSLASYCKMRDVMTEYSKSRLIRL